MKNGSLMIPLLALVGATVVACNGGVITEGQEINAPIDIKVDPDTIEKEYPTLGDLKPEATPPDKATIRLAGTAIEVELLEEREGSEVTYEWVYRIPEDEEAITSIEKEQYSTANNTFALVAGPAESFDPPIPLIKFPFAIGDNYEWRGTHRLGVTEKPASATINTQTDTLNLSVGKFEAVLVTVNLNVQTGNPAGTDSIFKFWFKPGDGIVKREFGVSSSREPRESEAPRDRLEE